MINLSNHKWLGCCAIVALSLASCQQPGVNQTGSEYMPDMAHSVAYESNHYTYYYHNTWGDQDDYYKYAQARTPVAGTVPRGQAAYQFADDKKAAVEKLASFKGVSSKNGKAISVNGSVPYYYENSEEGRARAMEEIIDNPFPIVDAELEDAKELYNTFCGICHGEKGDGAGYLVRDDGGVYPAQPANFLLDEHVNASNGRYYHAIMHGRNLMGAYADKLSYEERWQVIHYIRALQAKDRKVEYNQYANTLNDVEVPAGADGMLTVDAFTASVERVAKYDGAMHGSHGHGEDHHGQEDHKDSEMHHEDDGHDHDGHDHGEHEENGHGNDGHDHEGHHHGDHDHGSH